jgi:hypothetical protein
MKATVHKRNIAILIEYLINILGELALENDFLAKGEC